MNCAAVRLELAVQYLFKGTVLLSRKLQKRLDREMGERREAPL
jgi:hypothetical protein